MLMRLPQVMREVGLCRSSIYAAVSQGRFPSPVKIGLRAVACRADEIEAWKASLRRGGPTPWGEA
jgi:prophage regulatory protein